MTINLNDFARLISEEEGLKKNTDIAQIKEITRLVLKNIRDLSFNEIMELLKRSK